MFHFLMFVIQDAYCITHSKKVNTLQQILSSETDTEVFKRAFMNSRLSEKQGGINNKFTSH